MHHYLLPKHVFGNAPVLGYAQGCNLPVHIHFAFVVGVVRIRNDIWQHEFLFLVKSRSHHFFPEKYLSCCANFCVPKCIVCLDLILLTFIENLKDVFLYSAETSWVLEVRLDARSWWVLFCWLYRFAAWKVCLACNLYVNHVRSKNVHGSVGLCTSFDDFNLVSGT